MLGNGTTHRFYLLSKLTGGRNHQKVRTAPQATTANTALFAMRQIIHGWQKKCCRFARTRLCGGKHVAVATLGSEDAMFVSTIRRYALDQETAVSACVLDDSLLYELSSFGGTLVAVTDDRFLALSGDGSLGGSYDYAYPYLRGSTLGGTDFGALVLSRYRSGSAGKLVTVGAEGNLIASLDTQRDVLDISAAGKYLAVLYSDELVIYTSDLAEYASLTDTQYARGVRMRADGSAILLANGHGTLYVP